MKEIEKPLLSLVDSYYNERRRLWKQSRIRQGRIDSQGASFQQELALSLFRKTPYEVLVDYPVQYRVNEKSKTLYCDILTVSTGFLHGILEVKIDLGFLNCDYFGFNGKECRYYSDNNEFKQKYREFLSAGEFSYKPYSGIRSGGDKKRVIIADEGSIAKGLLLVTSENHSERLSAFCEAVEDSGFRFLCLLDEKTHPNRRPEIEVIKNEEKHRRFISELKKDIRKNLKKREQEISSFISYFQE